MFDCGRFALRCLVLGGVVVICVWVRFGGLICVLVFGFGFMLWYLSVFGIALLRLGGLWLRLVYAFGLTSWFVRWVGCWCWFVIFLCLDLVVCCLRLVVCLFDSFCVLPTSFGFVCGGRFGAAWVLVVVCSITFVLVWVLWAFCRLRVGLVGFWV